MARRKVKIKPTERVLTKYLPTTRLVDPEVVYLPIKHDRTISADISVKPGDKVKVGQIIGIRNCGFYEQPIHATVSGTVKDNSKKFYRSGKQVECITIENDMKYVFNKARVEKTLDEILKMSREEVTKSLKDNAVIGLGGSGFPTYIKYETKDTINTILVNGVECEPLLSSDYRLMLEMPKRIIEGLVMAMNGIGAKNAVISVKTGKPEIVQVLNEAIEDYGRGFDISVCECGDYYPLGWEIETIRQTLGIKVADGVLPSKYGILTLNVSTTVGIYKALKYDMPILKRTFSVVGDGIKRDKAFRVRIGSPIKDLIDYCGGYLADRVNIIFGGPMMGAPMVSDDLVITKTSTSVIVLKERTYKEKNCIRCGACATVCPKDLLPALIMQQVKTKNKDAITKLRARSCIQCGLCSYACTSKIEVTDYLAKAKKLSN